MRRRIYSIRLMDVPRATPQLGRDGGYEWLFRYSLVPSRLSGPWYEHHDGHHEAHLNNIYYLVCVDMAMYVCMYLAYHHRTVRKLLGIRVFNNWRLFPETIRLGYPATCSPSQAHKLSTARSRVIKKYIHHITTYIYIYVFINIIRCLSRDHSNSVHSADAVVW